MAAQTYYIDVGLTTGLNDGSSRANAFRTVADFELIAYDLVTALDTVTVYVKSTNGTATASWQQSASWVTDATYFITLIFEDNPNGVWDSTIFHIQTTDPTLSGAFAITVPYTVTQGIVQLYSTYTGTSGRYVLLLNTNNVDFDRFIIRGDNALAATNQAGFVINDVNAHTNTIKGGIVYDIATGAYNKNTNAGSANEFNFIVAAHCLTGFNGNDNYKVMPIARNCVAIDCATAGWTTDASNSWDTTNSVNNASFDSTHPAASGGVALTSNAIADYFNSTSDFHLNPAATYYSELHGAGVTVSGITVDIDGDTWPSPPSIGADAGTTGATGVTISTVPSTVARGETGLTITGTSFGAIEGTLTFGGELCTVTLWTDTSITFTVPSTINLLYATATHAFIVTADDTTSDTSAAVPFTPESGRSYIALVSPVYSSDQYLAYGYEGTPAPVSTDQLEYPDSTTPSAIPFTVNADSEWILDSMPSVNQTVDIQIIRAATSVRSTTWTVTYQTQIIQAIPVIGGNMFRRVRLQDDNNNSAMDIFVNGVITIDANNSEVHKGNAYTISNTTTVATTANFDILIKVPANEIIHLQDYFYTSDVSPCTVTLYEAPTTTADGTPITVLNKNRGSIKTTGITAFTAPTVTGVGTLMESTKVTSTKLSAGSKEVNSIQWLLAPSTNYLIRFNNANAGNAEVDYNLFWFEG